MRHPPGASIGHRVSPLPAAARPAGLKRTRSAGRSGCSFTTSPFWQDTRRQRSYWNTQRTLRTPTESAGGGQLCSAKTSACCVGCGYMLLTSVCWAIQYTHTGDDQPGGGTHNCSAKPWGWQMNMDIASSLLSYFGSKRNTQPDRQVASSLAPAQVTDWLGQWLGKWLGQILLEELALKLRRW